MYTYNALDEDFSLSILSESRKEIAILQLSLWQNKIATIRMHYRLYSYNYREIAQVLKWTINFQVLHKKISAGNKIDASGQQ